MASSAEHILRAVLTRDARAPRTMYPSHLRRGAGFGQRHWGRGSAVLHLISSRQMLERTLFTPGRRIS